MTIDADPTADIPHPADQPGAYDDAVPKLPPAPGFVEYIVAQMGLTPDVAEILAPAIQQRVSYERTTGLARRFVRDEQLARDADFAGIDVVSAVDLLERDRPPRRRVFGDLVLAGHNVTVVARYKVGKSTLSETMVWSATTGSDFLGRYPVADPLRVAYMNYELDERDMEGRIRNLRLPADALERLLVLNLRGRRLPLMTVPGRNWVVERLADHGTNLLIVDPFGAAYASAGGESENDNAEVRRFTTALDEIKRLAVIDTTVMPVHTGRAIQEEGEEAGRGASVVDDWPDVQMFLTKDKSGHRFLRTDGRAPFRLHESRIDFDETSGRLMLATDGLGLSRSKARLEERVNAVAAAVKEQPGLTGTDLKTAIHEVAKNNDDKASAIHEAIDRRLVHVHLGSRNSKLHHPGPSHLDEEECLGGWTP